MLKSTLFTALIVLVSTGAQAQKKKAANQMSAAQAASFMQALGERAEALKHVFCKVDSKHATPALTTPGTESDFYLLKHPDGTFELVSMLRDPGTVTPSNYSDGRLVVNSFGKYVVKADAKSNSASNAVNSMGGDLGTIPHCVAGACVKDGRAGSQELTQAYDENDKLRAFVMIHKERAALQLPSSNDEAKPADGLCPMKTLKRSWGFVGSYNALPMPTKEARTGDSSQGGGHQ